MLYPSRRQFLAMTAATLAVGAAPATMAASSAQRRSLKLRNLHTGETVEAVFWENGDYRGEGLKSLNRLLRDHRANEVTRMDPKLLDLVYNIKKKLGYKGTIEVISGYRSAKTNAKLRARSGGVAKRSYHTRGMAMDIRMPGVALSKVRQAARSLKVGGVGYYPKSNFVHVDTGPVRSW